MEAGGQANGHRYPFSEGGWDVSDFYNKVFTNLFTQNAGFAGYFVS
jgi:hypothetical protein